MLNKGAFVIPIPNISRFLLTYKQLDMLNSSAWEILTMQENQDKLEMMPAPIHRE